MTCRSFRAQSGERCPLPCLLRVILTSKMLHVIGPDLKKKKKNLLTLFFICFLGIYIPTKLASLQRCRLKRSSNLWRIRYTSFWLHWMVKSRWSYDTDFLAVSLFCSWNYSSMTGFSWFQLSGKGFPHRDNMFWGRPCIFRLRLHPFPKMKDFTFIFVT